MANTPKVATMFISNNSIREDVKVLVNKNPLLTETALINAINKALTGSCSNTTQTRRRNIALSLLEDVRNEVNVELTKAAKKLYSKTYRDNNKERIAATRKRYYAKNKSKVLDLCKRWRAANPDKVRAYAAKWRAANPDKVKAYTEKRKQTIVKNNNNVINNNTNNNNINTATTNKKTQSNINTNKQNKNNK